MPDEMTEEEELRRWAEGWGVPPTRDEALRRAVRACLDELAQRRDAEKPELVWEFSVGDGRWSARCRGREYGISFEATDCYLCGLGSYRTLAEAQAACQADADAAPEEAKEEAERMRLKRIASLQKFLAKMRTLQIKIPKGEIPDAR